MKYSSTPYSLTKKEDEDYRIRLADFLKVTNTKSAIVLTMISPYGIQKNAYANLIGKTIELADLIKV